MVTWLVSYLYDVGFDCLTRTSQEIDSSVQSVVDSFSPFTRLSTLSILPPRGANTDSLYMKVLISKDAVATASRFVQGIPALTRLAFPLSFPADETLWYAKSRDVAMVSDVVIGCKRKKHHSVSYSN